jgi:FMN phosphatase YigB (HAD superfamily)
MSIEHWPRTVVILDLDGTLIPDRNSFREAAATVLNTHLAGQQPPDPHNDPVQQLLYRARSRWRESPLRDRADALGLSSWEALWTDLDQTNPATEPFPTGHAITVWRDTLTDLGANPEHARSAARMLITQREALTRPYPGARDALKQLAVRHRLWLATHGSSGLQRRKLRLAGLEQYFALTLISAEVGRLKSTPEFAALIHDETQQSGLSVRAVIGDGDSDLALAAHGGWPAIHICSHWPCDRGDSTVQHHKTIADLPWID